MKIMQVIPEFGLGGAETMCANLSVELSRMGNDVTAVSLYSSETPITKRLTKAGIRVLYLDKKQGLNISVIFKLIKIMREEKPDVVHSHLYSAKYAHIAAIISKVKKRVHTIHNIAEKDGGKQDHIVNRFLFKKCNVIPISLSDDVRKTVVSFYKIAAPMTPVILNGVPLDKCKPISEYRILATKFLHIGRFSEQKNHIELIKAFVAAHEKCEKIELYLYGEGELEEKCKSLVSDLGAYSYIHFCGTTNDVYSVMHQMDVFILPSLWEGIPMTLIEAMGTCLPIIASKVGGIENMLSDGESGILIKPIQQEITDSILTVHDDYCLRKKLGEGAKNISVDFSAQNMAKEYIKVYQRSSKNE